MKSAKHSFYDTDKRLWVACNECSRGANGEKSCAGASNGKTFKGLGCFCGALLSNLTIKENANK